LTRRLFFGEDSSSGAKPIGRVMFNLGAEARTPGGVAAIPEKM
jgi:hypothetical protein